MKNTLRIAALALAVPFAIGATQQQLASTRVSKTDTPTIATSDKDSATAAAKLTQFKPIVIQNFRANDTRGLNVFEAPKDAGVAFTGFKVDWGVGFQQEFQGLKHWNSATPVVVAGVNTTQLMTIGKGFNTATANLDLNAQLGQADDQYL